MSASRFMALALAVVAVLFAGSEVVLRNTEGLEEGKYARYVLRVFREPGRNLIIGDSHLIKIRRPEGWNNLSRAGLVTAELARVLNARLKFVGIDRVIIEAGPQMLMKERQADYRSLPPDTLSRQIFPVPVMTVEPSLISSAVDIAVRETGRIVSSAYAAGRKQEPSTDAERVKGVRARTWMQRPVPYFTQSPSWHRLWQAVDQMLGAGVEVCLIQAPVMDIYVDVAENLKVPRYRAALTAVRQAAAEREIRFVAAADLSRSYPDRLFDNVDHLTRKGAIRYWTEMSVLCFPDA
jgi:hypothetical protein